MFGAQIRRWGASGRRAALMSVLLLPLPAAANPVLSFDVGLRVEHDTNASLSGTGKLPRSGAQLRFGLGLLSETAISRLEITAEAALAGYRGRGARLGSGNGLVTPALGLSYYRGVADADLTLEARLSQSDLSAGDPGDLDFNARGTRRTAKLSAALNWRKTAPLGFGLTASHEDTRYDDAPGQPDRKVDKLGASVRADLTEVLQARLSLGTQSFRRVGRDTRRSHSAQLTLAHQRPTGSLQGTLGLEDTPEGNRLRLSLGQEIEWPTAALRWSLGAVRDSRGKVKPRGDLTWEQELPDGGLTVSLSRDVSSSDIDDRETLQNRLSVAYHKQITETARLQLGASFTESSYSATGSKVTGSQLSAVWSQALTEAWGLDLGYVHRLRKTSLSPRTSSDRIYVEMRRGFAVRF